MWIDSSPVTGYIPAPEVPTMNFLAYKLLNYINPIPSDYTVDVLFGQDCPDIIKVLEIRYDGPGELYASRFVLGWSVCGPTLITLVCNSTKSDMYREELSHNLKLEETVQSMWTLENELSDETSHSHEDRAVMQYWDENVSVEDDHYVVPTPWKRKQGKHKETFCRKHFCRKQQVVSHNQI